MNAVILCPGPSLAAFGGDFEGLVIAVNRAALWHRCDVWACGDLPLYERVCDRVIGSPTWFTSANAAAVVRDHHQPWRGPVVEFESLAFDRERAKWDTFTATAALVYARHRGATYVTTYGADWQGTADMDGERAGGNRSPDRWKLEAGIWGRIVAQLGIRWERGL